MVNPEFTYIFCHDEKRNFSVEVRRRFNDAGRYEVIVSTGRHELLNMVKERRAGRLLKVALLPMAGTPDQNDNIRLLAEELRTISPDIQIILLVGGESPEELVIKSGIRPYSWVPLSNNSVLRIHNSVKKLISEETLTRKSRRLKIAFRFMLAFAAASFMLVLYARLRFPQYF
ncbi:MAG: hypothetical protein FJY11_05870 [Bacteroidetes bacterium]|nr:hypothetical protein [Bacteroidota bacterium]